MLTGLLLGAFVGWLVFNLYEQWAAKSAAVALIPGPAYVPVEHIDERADGGRRGSLGDVEGSPSKHTRHGTPYSSYSVGRGFLGRIPSSRFYKPLPLATQERTKTISSDKSFVWPSLPSSSRPSSSHWPAKTTSSTRSTATPDDPFASTRNNSTGMDMTPVVVSRTSTRSTFAHASRFGEMWSDHEEEDQDSVVVSSPGSSHRAEGEGEMRAGPLKMRSKSKSAKGKKREEKSMSGANELDSPAKETSPRKSSWNLHRISGSPSMKPDSYTAVPVRTSSPRSQSFRTPESSPRKPSYVLSSEKVRFVDRSILPASPPTLTSPRLESEFFVSAIIFDPPSTPTPKRTRSPRVVTGFRTDEEWSDTDTLPLGATPLPSPKFGEAERSHEDHSPTKYDSRPEPVRRLSTASVSTISEFPGDPPPKRTPAERFYARHSALNKVEEILQKSRSQTGIANATMSPGRLTLDTVEEDKQFGRVGRESRSG